MTKEENGGQEMYDEQNYRFTTKNKIIDLTTAENKILKLLFENKGNIVTYETICLELYKQKLDCYFKANISVIICRLRAKLKDEIRIVTKNGVGYYMF